MIPFFSIIIPTYNRCEFLKIAIYKLQQQTFENWECIIIDDGSIDSTNQDIPLFIKSDIRFKYEYQQNSERAIARNNGAKLAKGTYFIFLDSDDFFEENHLLDLYQSILSTNEQVAMYFTNCKILKDNTQLLLLPEGYSPSISVDYFVENSVIPARVCLHHSIIQEVQFDPRAIVVEDTVLWTEIVDIYPVIYFPIKSVIYSLHENNSVNVKKFNAYLKRLIGLTILFEKKSVGIKIKDSVKNNQLNRCYTGISEYYLYQDKKIQSFFWILKSISKFPTFELRHKLYLLKKIILSK
jgi:glycosyltransferase involved in cell wall biosynthesis